MRNTLDQLMTIIASLVAMATVRNLHASERAMLCACRADLRRLRSN